LYADLAMIITKSLLIKLPGMKEEQRLQGILKSMHRVSNLYVLPIYTVYKDTLDAST
jgi:hypothetical protein